MNPRRDARFWHHRGKFMEHINIEQTNGLEIGAFDLPLVSVDEGTCAFADYNSTEFLKDEAFRLSGHSPEHVVDVRYDLKRGYGEIPAVHDWVTGSHVIEHVPDLLGWFISLKGTLREGGLCLLAVPDKRYTFDHYRSTSTFADVLEAYEQKRTRPSYRNVLDHHINAAPVIAHDVWAGNALPEPSCSFEVAVALARQAENKYVDAHCWVFTPGSFRALLGQLERTRLMPFSLMNIYQTQIGFMDFTVILQAR